MAAGDAYVFPGFLTPVLTQLCFPKPPTTFLTCFCRGERQKYAGKKSLLNQGSNSQPPGHESDTLTTERPGRGAYLYSNDCINEQSLYCTEGKIFPAELFLLGTNAQANRGSECFGGRGES